MSGIAEAAGRRGGGPVVVDLRALQSPHSRTALPVRLALELANGLEARYPGLAGRYLLAPDWPPPGDLGDLLGTGKIAYAGTTGAIRAEARVYLSLFCYDLGVDTAKLWPAIVETEGLSFCAAVHSLNLGNVSPTAEGETSAGRSPGSAEEARRRRPAASEALRHADAVLATSDRAVGELAAIGVDPARITLLGAALADDVHGAVVPTAAGAPATSSSAPGTGESVLLGEAACDRAADVLERLGRRQRRAWRRPQRRRRLALVSPFPPVPSGVASYSSRLVRALRAELHSRDPQVELDCFADGRDRVTALPSVPGEAWYDARSFGGIDAARAGYDQAVLVLGNSQFHAGALRALRRRSGAIVMAHDVRMTNLLRYSSSALPPHAVGLDAAIKASDGDLLPEGPGRDNEVSAADEEAYGLLLLRDIAVHASRVLVNSSAAERLAAVDLGPDLSGRLGVLPFSIALEPADLLDITTAANRRGTGPLRIVSFGIVDPIKQLDVLVGAAAGMIKGGIDVELFFVGPVSDSVRAHLGCLASEVGIGERVQVTGLLARDGYLAHLGQADVAVQLRARDGGEASAAVGDCLAAGVPTVVSRIGWLGELPEDVVVKVPRRTDAVQLADVLKGLLIDGQWRAGLSARASDWAARQTFERAAGALLDASGIS